MTYIERDIRQLVNISNLRTFTNTLKKCAKKQSFLRSSGKRGIPRRTNKCAGKCPVRDFLGWGRRPPFENFLKIIASQSGQLVNYSSLSNLSGISLPTAKSWLSLLETSGIIFILQPHHRSFAKRVVKTPKLFFNDTGLLCFLLSVRDSRDLKSHPLYGNIFETFVISEFYKRICHIAEIPPLYFWRDKTGNEIDLLVDFGYKLYPLEIKASRTYSASFKDNIAGWLGLKGNTQTDGLILYNGEGVLGGQSNIPTAPWWRL